MKAFVQWNCLAAGIAAFTMLASAQSKLPVGGGSTGSRGTLPTTNTPPTTNLPSNTTTTNPNNPNNPTNGINNRPIFLTGKVTLSDGSPPPLSTVIQRVCAGAPRTAGYTDGKGNFSFQLGQNPEVIDDASLNRSQGMGSTPSPNNGGIRNQDLVGCELRAFLAGYRSSSVDLSNQRYMDNPEVGTIVLQRLANVEGLTISATAALAPKDAQKAYNKGLEAVKKGNPDDAQKDFQKAVAVYPKYAYAWYELGRVYEQRDHVDDARNAYTQSIAADSKYVNPYERMYMLSVHDGKWDDVARITDEVLRLNPYDFPGAYFYNAVANMNLNKLDPAEKSARAAVKADAGRNPRTGYVLGLVLARKGDFASSSEYLAAYLKTLPDGKEADVVKKQLADAQKSAQAKATDAPKAPDK